MKTANNVGISSRSLKDEKNNNTVDLVDISTVMVEQGLSKLEKTVEYIKQIKDPFNYKCGKFIVTARFPDSGPTIEECLQGMMT